MFKLNLVQVPIALISTCILSALTLPCQAQGNSQQPYQAYPQGFPNINQAPAQNYRPPQNNPYYPNQPIPNQPNLYVAPQFKPTNQSPTNRKVNLNNRYRYLIRKARKLITSGNANNALPILQEASTINPKHPEVYFWKGLALDELKGYKDAVKNYATCLRLAANRGMDSAELRINLGNTLIKLGFLKEAIFDYKRAIEITPTSGLPYLYLGRAYLIKEDFNLALDQFRTCEDLSLHNTYLPFFKSLALVGLKRYQDARLELRPLLTSYAKAGTPNLFRLASTLNSALKNAPEPKSPEKSL